jgi:hypothetical protein
MSRSLRAGFQGNAAGSGSFDQARNRNPRSQSDSPLRPLSIIIREADSRESVRTLFQESPKRSQRSLGLLVRKGVTYEIGQKPDGKRLFIATEKGEIVVWDISSHKAERTLRQASPVHFIAALSDPREINAAGSKHQMSLNALVRKWNVDTGTFVDFAGVDRNSFPTGLVICPRALTGSNRR